MQKIILSSLICLAMSTLGYSQTTDAEAIKSTITAFAKAGDNNAATELEKYLDDNYRVVMNRLFGSPDVSILTKEIYLEKIRTKEFGGDQRILKIRKLVLNGSTASAQVTFKGTKLTFISLITLIKDAKGVWKLVSEVPIVS